MGPLARGDEEPDDEERCDSGQNAQVPAAHRSRVPEPEFIHGRLIHQDDRRGDGTEEGGERCTREDQTQRIRTAPTDRGHREHDGGAQGRPDECGPHVDVDVPDPEEIHGEHDSQCGTGGNPEYPGIRERIPGVSLDECTGDPESRTRDDGEGCARYPLLPHDDPGLRVGAAPHTERLPDVSRRGDTRTDMQRQQDGETESHGHQEHERPPEGAETGDSGGVGTGCVGAPGFRHRPRGQLSSR